MSKHKVGYLMDLEKSYLFIKHGHQIEMTISEMVEVDKHLERVGKITEKYFEACKLYERLIRQIPNAEELLRAYSDKLLNEDIEIDISESEEYLNKLLENHPDWIAVET